MLYDTYHTGYLWSPLDPPEDQMYAVVTGASSGLGRELASLLYIYGYSLVLIARDVRELERAKEYIQTNQALSAVRGEKGQRQMERLREQEIITISSDLVDRESTDNIKEELQGSGVYHKVMPLPLTFSPCVG